MSKPKHIGSVAPAPVETFTVPDPDDLDNSSYGDESNPYGLGNDLSAFRDDHSNYALRSKKNLNDVGEVSSVSLLGDRSRNHDQLSIGQSSTFQKEGGKMSENYNT